MAKDRIPARPQDLGDLHVNAERLVAVLVTIEHATDPGTNLAHDPKAGELQLGLLMELMPRAIRMARELTAGLGRADEDYVRRDVASAAGWPRADSSRASTAGGRDGRSIRGSLLPLRT